MADMCSLLHGRSVAWKGVDVEGQKGGKGVFNQRAKKTGRRRVNHKIHETHETGHGKSAEFGRRKITTKFAKKEFDLGR
jgi:hypothetical protein